MRAYLADLDARGALEVAFVRSPFPHAAFGAIRGAGAVASDLGLRDLTVTGPGLRPRPWPALGCERTRFVGEAVAAVWAEDRARAEDLADRVEVDWEPLDPDPPETLYELAIEAGDLEACFARADRVIERSYRAARQAPLPLETRGVLAAWDGARLTVWSSTQVPHVLRHGIAVALGMEEAEVRVRVPQVGGGFGLKAHVFPEELALASLARRLGRPVRWVEDRRENLLAGVHAHDNRVRVRAAVSAGGRVLAVDAEVVADVGAYSIYPFSASLEPATCATALFAPYDLAALRVGARAVTSHRCPVGAYRGVGTTSAVFATERMMDAIAADLGLDPLEIRRRNALSGLPRTTLSGRELDSGDYLELLDRLDRRSAYASLRSEQQAARRAGRLVGLGLALFNEHSGTGRAEYRKRGNLEVPGTDAARVRVDGAGRIVVHMSSVEIGQGLEETVRLVAAGELGVEPDQVEVAPQDTDLSPPGTGSFVSRGAVGLLDAVIGACRQAAERDLQPGTDVTCTVDPRQVYPSGAHLALVEVDPVGFVPRVVRYFAVEDCGAIVNRRAVDAQLRGGVAMGIGKALLEESAYGSDGQPLTATLLDYLVPLAPDVPPIELEHLESPSPRTALGSKGVGESGTIGAVAAVANAVADAVAPLGAELTELPFSPDRIFAAVESAGPASAGRKSAPPRG